MTTTIELPRLASYQKAAIFCEERNAIIEASSKAGKTVGCLYWLFSEAMNNGGLGREFWWVAPVHDQARIAYDRMKTMLTQTDKDKSIWASNDTERSIKFVNGSTCRFKTAEKPDNLYGEDVYAAIYDEASRGREASWNALQSTLTATDGKVRVIGNVRGRKNWAYRLARRVEAGQLPSWHFASINALDAVKAGIIKQSVLDERRAVLPDHIFRELFFNEPSEDGGNPFGLQHIGSCVQPMSTDPAEVFGVDLAKSVDWTVVIGLDKQMRVCVFERWQHEPWDRTSERILGIVGSKPTLIDSTGVGDPVVEGLQRKAPSIDGFKFTNASKQQLMEGLAVKIQSHACGFPDGTIRQELDNFEYDTERERVYYSAPEGFHDDCVVGLGLAVEKARAHVPVTASVVSMGVKAEKQAQDWFKEWGERAGPESAKWSVEEWKKWYDAQQVQVVFSEKRKDLNWGWGEGNGSGKVSVSERYRR